MCGLGALCAVFSCCFHVHFVCKQSLGHVFPLSHVLLCVFAVSTKLFTQFLWLLVLLCFDMWLNSHLGVIMCVFFFFCFVPAFLITLLHPSAPIFTHPWSFLPPHSHPNPIHNIPGIFPAIHTQNIRICTHPYPQVPFLIVFPSQHTPTHPTHPSTPIANHNYIHIHYMRNMQKFMIFKV